MIYNIVIVELGIVLIVATLFAYLAKGLKQPLIPAYIISGLMIGPVLGLVKQVELINTLSEIGIAFLLFIVGLEIDFKRLKNVAEVSTIGGSLKMLFLFITGFILTRVLGYNAITGIYLGIIVAFSSTMVVVKLLSDKRELDTLHGRIVLGVLLMEDLIAIIALAMLANTSFSIDLIILSILKIIFLIVISFFLSIYILPSLFKFAAKTKELLFLASISVLFFFCIFSMTLNISLVIGAFIAGVALANLPYNYEIIGKVMSLKDFFATIFFVSIGMSISFGAVANILVPLICFLLLIILFKPLLCMVIITMMGYKKRPAFLSSISLSQISEFALILAAQGMIIGHIHQDIYTLTVMLALITMGLTSYYINFDNQLYLMLKKKLKIFEKILPHKKFHFEYMAEKPKYDIVLCGHNRVGFSIYKTIKKMKKSILIIDFNPEVIRDLMERKISCLYGDIGDMEILERINFKDAKMIISTIPDKHDNVLLLKTIKKSDSKAITFVTAMDIDDALELYEKGSDYVILPHFLGGEHVAFMINKLTLDITQVIKDKNQHIKELKHRRIIDHNQRNR
ncbi:MAG: cation:proton antiporter [Nanoarchaeota archaeon]|nr:cation:proton antiporter [Nanoarchaeota archaeon]